jgi:hypothetical protein
MGESNPLLSAQELDRFQMRTLQYLAGELPADELSRFNDELGTQRTLREIFVDFCLLSGLLIEHQLNYRLGEPMGSPSPSTPEMTLMGQHFNFVEEQLDLPQAPSADQPQSASASDPEPMRPRAGWLGGILGRFPWRIAAAILLPLTLAIVGWMVFRPAVSSATLATSVDAQWDSGAAGPTSGERLPAKTLNLKSGLAEMRLASGASVIVEGPAKFRVGQDNAVDLDSGRLTAVVPVAAHGFSVRTPSAVVVDLGTDFGVSVNASGETTVSVFQGRVEVAQRSGDTASPSSAPTTLSAGDAATVANGAVTLSAGGATPQAFVRSLSAPSAIDVVDLVCGGDGTTHRRSGGIDPRTGDAGLLPAVGTVDTNDLAYHAVPKLQVVDGCFIPDGEIKIDSAGHTYDFGNTTGGSFYDIRAGGTFPWPVPYEKFTGTLGGIDYAKSGHGLILMQPNCGITLDLSSLRHVHPGLKMSDFRAVVGNSYRAGSVHGADVLVLVDGVPRFEQRNVRRNDARIDVDVPLTDADHYLTIATTDQGVTPTNEWIIFGDPRLE